MTDRDKLQDHVLAARTALFEADLAIAMNDLRLAELQLDHAMDNARAALRLLRKAIKPPSAK